MEVLKAVGEVAVDIKDGHITSVNMCKQSEEHEHTASPASGCVTFLMVMQVQFSLLPAPSQKHPFRM